MPYGTVKSKSGDYATVVLERQDMCGDCHACEMLSGKKECTLSCQCLTECEVGDQVEITLSQERFIKATYLMYGIPLIGFVMGLFGGYGIGLLVGAYIELIAMVGCVIGTTLGFMFLKIKDRKKDFQKFLPKIVGKK